MTVPIFKGDQSEWETFKELFCSIIKDKIHLSPVVKLQHLLNCVEGPAAQRLKGIKIVGTNLEVAWDKLVRRYDNPKIRLASHLETLINVPPIKRRGAGEINRLIDTVEEAIQGLKDLDCPVNEWDNILVYLVARKLDPNTREHWEVSQEDKEGFPKFKDLSTFLERRVHSLEQARSIEENSGTASKVGHSQNKNSCKTRQIFAHTSSIESNKSKSKPFGKNLAKSCIICKGSHFTNSCEKFNKLSVQQRWDLCQREKRCVNCLQKSHPVTECPSTGLCYVCQGRHHTKLHLDAKTQASSESYSSREPGNDQKSDGQISSVQAHSTSLGKPILLATAQVVLMAPHGDKLSVRALIDPAAESSFISEHVAQALSLPVRKVSANITGVGATITAASHREVSLTLLSRMDNAFQLNFHAYVLTTVAGLLPSMEVNSKSWPHVDQLTLADPHYGRPGRIDCILGADTYAVIIRPGLEIGPPNSPVAQATALGWILTGQTGGVNHERACSVIQGLHTQVDIPLTQAIARLWDLEEIPAAQRLSPEEELCEDLFKLTTSRNNEGRYVVKLPFVKRPVFPDSRDIAVSCLLRSEKRRQKDKQLDQIYSHFMDEYLKLGHMELIQSNDDNLQACYLPHHGVFRNDGSQKIRVVFNASQRYGNGFSLNDCLLPGPKLQVDITLILTRWRFYRFVFTTDMVKMFRQIRIHPDDADWQRIVWRRNSSVPIQDYRLTTVTYGTKPAPYLAIRALHQLAEDGEAEYPEAAKILRKQTYVDDTFAGADDIESATEIRDQLRKLLATAGISLGKWSANHCRLLEDICQTDSDEFSLDLDEIVSTLGLKWIPKSDSFLFKISLPESPDVVTKRSILSEIARLFDPLGWLAPFLIQAKIILQDLWRTGLDWDTPITGDLLNDWMSLRSQLPDLETIKFSRWFGILTTMEWHIHAFADASKRAYAAAVYIVQTGGTSSLVMAKAKVAPVKTISIPKLELQGAVSMVRLLRHIMESLPGRPATINCWSDSKVVLAWLHSHSSRWHTFVANRVGEIHSLLPEAKWRHVRTTDNPADCATRGYTSKQLRQSTSWWNGPDWLVEEPNRWPAQDNTDLTSEEHEIIHAHFSQKETANPHEDTDVLSFLQKFSTISKIIRILAYCFRWKLNVQKAKGVRSDGWLTASELCAARVGLFKAIQRHYFAEEFARLQAGRRLSKRSPLARLCPFICAQGLVRVGGRLQNSMLKYQEKHPIILPGKCIFSKLLVREAHQVTLHGGVQLMMSHLVRFVWILRSKRLIQGIIRSCVRCARFTARTDHQIMAPLPTERLTPRRAFAFTGLDYAGPIPVRTSKGKGVKSYKGYIAIFICILTKATHIEIVSDLSSQAFLAAFRRFTARRGHCSRIYSDNATTFIGADAEIRRLFTETSELSKEVAAAIARDGTEWSFIPPRAPHFGGLWEAAVKSFKYHFRRIIGDSTLSYEELSTLVAQIEACLNSRPLCPLSNDPNDYAALTPGHFLVGEPLTVIAEPFSNIDLCRNLRTRWDLTTRMRNHFWHRWRSEVLHHLQQRNKWLEPTQSLKRGDMVLLKDELQPPAKWALGRVTELHPGKDGLVRVITVKTASSEFRRPIVKVIRLPMDDETIGRAALLATYAAPTSKTCMAGGGASLLP